METVHIFVAGKENEVRGIVQLFNKKGVHVSYMPILPSNLANEERAKVELIKEEVSKKKANLEETKRVVKKSKSLLPFFGKKQVVHEFYDEKIGVRLSEIEQGLEVIDSEVDSNSAVQTRLLKSNGQKEVSSFKIIKNFAQLNALCEVNGPIRASFIMFGFKELFTSAGAEFLGGLQHFSEDSLICFKGAFPNIRQKLQRFDFRSANLVFQHPIVNPTIIPNELVLIQITMLDGQFNKLLLNLQEFDISVVGSRDYKSKDKAIQDLVEVTNDEETCLGLLPLILGVQVNNYLGDITSELTYDPIRIETTLSAANEILKERYESLTTSMGETVDKIYNSHLSSKPFDSISLEEMMNDKYALDRYAKVNSTTSCANYLNEVKYVDSFPAFVLNDPSKERYKKVIRNYFQY